MSNILQADLTVLVGNMHSRGSRLAIAFAKGHGKPLLQNPTPKELATYITTHKPEVINVGGNRASANPGAWQMTYDLVSGALGILEE